MLEAYRKGEAWALDDISESFEFYDQLFRFPEYQIFEPFPKAQ